MFNTIIAILLTASAAYAMDFDFTRKTPVSNGQIPMIKLQDFMTIGGTPQYRSLEFNGKNQPISVEESEKISATNGLSIAFEAKFADKGESTNSMLIMKPKEWLLGRNGKTLYFNLYSKGNWGKGVKLPMDFSDKIKLALIYSPNGRLVINDGKTSRVIQLDQERPDTGDKPVIIGGGWGELWNFKGEIYRLKISPQTWSQTEIEGFFK